MSLQNGQGRKDMQENQGSKEESPFKGKAGLGRVWNAIHYSADGLRATYRCEDAFRQEIWLAAVLIPLALLLPVSGVARALMIGSILLILVIELVNSAIEAAIDRIGPERHPLSKRAKDAGSAAVLVALVNAAAVWASILAEAYG
jgi:diacylglycerol kinase (ATP)